MVDSEKPNVFLLPTPEGKFFYNTNKNEFVSLCESDFLCLANEISMKNSIESFAGCSALNNLKTQGYLSTNIIETIQHPATEWLDELLERQISQIELQITQNCNFRCAYCPYTAPEPGMQRKHQNNRMNWATAKKAVDYLWSHSIDSDGVTIGFYGGEPLLEFELIKKVVAYSQKLFWGKSLIFSMTTNASLLDDEKATFLHEHNFHLIFSLDGPEKIQNRNRKFATSDIGTYTCVTKNIKRIIHRYPSYIGMLGINIVIDPKDSLEDVFSIIQEGSIYEGIETQATLINDSSLETKHPPDRLYQDQFEYHIFLSILKNVGLLSHSYISPLTDMVVKDAIRLLEKKMIPTEQVPTRTAAGGMCVPGVNKLFVSVEGKLYTCERVNEPSKAGYLGELDTGIDVNCAKRLLNVSTLTANECARCWAYRYCYSCVSHCDNGNDLCRKTRLENCEKSRRTIAYRMQLALFIRQLPNLKKVKHKKGQVL